MPLILRSFLLLVALPLLTVPAAASTAPFDLAGPALKVSVTHGDQTLPIAEVPNLSVGDRVAIAADLPADQGARYLLVAGFLRGATNPPPKDWFFKAETWQKKHNDLSLTVPAGARQLVVFLVPETGGGFDAVVNAVRKRPGAFVRASQELNQASLDRARLDAFLQAIHQLERSDPAKIEKVSPLLTHSLAIKLKADCLQQATDLQAACLTQDREALLLADSHSSALAETLIGAPTDLAFQLSATPQGKFGYYSSYIGVIRDVASILGAFQSIQFQYIPALGRTRDDRMSLLLNAVPSFAKPKTVMVVALPAVEPPVTPPLRPADSAPALCAARSGLALQVEGAPLIYASRYARDMVLRTTRADGTVADIPLSADPERGGYVLGQGAIPLAGYGPVIEGKLRGDWGFVPFEGPTFRLQNPTAGSWKADADAAGSLVTGRDNTLVLQGTAAGCIDRVDLHLPSGATQSVAWKVAGADRIAVTLPLDGVAPGKLGLTVQQAGVASPETIALTARAEAGRLDSFTLNAGDSTGMLAGTRLDTVKALSVGDVVFRPGSVDRVGKADQLSMSADAAPPLAAGAHAKAKVEFADGQTRTLSFTVAPPRPSARLIGETVVRPPAGAGLAITLGGQNVVPQDGQLTFSLHAAGTTRFTGAETIEVATADGRASTSITASNGFTLQNDQVAVVALDPGKALGVSAYGPLRFRLVRNGAAGDWVPLATLVRLPGLAGLTCESKADTCALAGSGLFLIDAIADNAAFTDATTVPEGFTGAALSIKRPAAGTLYLRLRDDPAIQATVTLPAG